MIWKYAQETKKHSRVIPLKERIPLLWKNPLLRIYYQANFFIYFGIYSFFSCLAIYVERKFDFTTTYLTYIMSYDSLFFAAGTLLLVPLVARYWRADKITYLFALIFGGLLLLLLVTKHTLGLIYTIPPIGVTLAVLMTYAAVMVSNGSEDELQGQAL